VAETAIVGCAINFVSHRFAKARSLVHFHK
jgi:hypothetical protein